MPFIAKAIGTYSKPSYIYSPPPPSFSSSDCHPHTHTSANDTAPEGAFVKTTHSADIIWMIYTNTFMNYGEIYRMLIIIPHPALEDTMQLNEVWRELNAVIISTVNWGKSRCSLNWMGAFIEGLRLVVFTWHDTRDVTVNTCYRLAWMYKNINWNMNKYAIYIYRHSYFLRK